MSGPDTETPRRGIEPRGTAARTRVSVLIVALLGIGVAVGATLLQNSRRSGGDGQVAGASADAASAEPSSDASPAGPATGGTTFYLAPNGSDRADGSLDHPRRTILAGSELLRPGDTLLIRGGTYDDPGGYNWAPTASGTPAEPITVGAYPGEQPIFDGGASGPADGYTGHPQIALIVKQVSYVMFQDLTFTHYDPFNNGVVLVVSASHITFKGIHSLANYSKRDTEHQFYVSHSSDIVIDSATLDGIAGAGVHIYDSDYQVGSGAVGSSGVTVRNSTISGPGRWGIGAGTGLSGGTFSGNTITGHDIGIEFFTPTTGVAVTQNTIVGPVGISTDLTDYGGYGPASETNDCIDSPEPFKVGWPGSPMSLPTWQSTGRGVGTTVGSCDP